MWSDERVEEMKWSFYTVGKPALSYAKAGAAEYLKRLRRYAPCEHVILKRGDMEELKPLLGNRGPGTMRIVMDERGELLTTGDLVSRVQGWQLDAVKQVGLFVGGSDGHPAEARESADLVLGLSGFTLQHELALVVLLEQVYRVHTVLRGEPYHRGSGSDE